MRRYLYYLKLPKGAQFEQPMKFEFVINLEKAKKIGLTILPNVLARADKVLSKAKEN